MGKYMALEYFTNVNAAQTSIYKPFTIFENPCIYLWIFGTFLAQLNSQMLFFF